MDSAENSAEFLDRCIDAARQDAAPSASPATAVDTLSSDKGFVIDSEDVSSSSSSPYSVSELEARSYYAGLPSKPVLVYRTSTTPWRQPIGDEVYRELKELRPVFNHKIATVWNTLGQELSDCLLSAGVTCTSIDLVRFAKVEQPAGPPVVWVGVEPGSLSGKDAHTAAVGCKEILGSYEITDVEIEFRESRVI